MSGLTQESIEAHRKPCQVPGWFGPTTARLVVDPCANLRDLADDLSALMAASLGAFEAMTGPAAEAAGASQELKEAWFPALYALRQTGVICDALLIRIYALDRMHAELSAATAVGRRAPRKGA